MRQRSGLVAVGQSVVAGGKSANIVTIVNPRQRVVWRDSDISREHNYSPGHIPSPDLSPPGQFPLILHGVGHSPFHRHHQPIYNIERSTANVYKIDSGISVRVRIKG